MVYAGADITKAEQAREIIAFADYWRTATGADPGLLVFDSQPTTYGVLNELSDRGLHWLTLRKRGPKLCNSSPRSPPAPGPAPASAAPAATAAPSCTKRW